jgi:spore germination protein YaaH
MKITKRLVLTLIVILLVSSVFLSVRLNFFGLSEEDRQDDLSSHPIVLVWELAGIEPDYTSSGPLDAVNVVSPTWFHLDSSEGNIRNELDPAYLDWARDRDYQVWVLVTNSFDPDLTAAVLANEELRRQVARELVDLAAKYELDGLNIDFENFHSDYKNQFTDFVQELAILTREHDMVLSVDVSMISNDEYWSLGYDRKALAEAADYLMLMAYDEHWETSPRAGSVASLPWVEQGIKLTLEYVPADKLILGVPFYTRLWEIDEESEPPLVLNSWSYSMTRAEEIIADNQANIYYDQDSGQNVAEYTKDGLTYRMWLEDSQSMHKRLELMAKYNLAGVAAWRRGLEKPEIWELFKTFFD